MSRLLSLLFVFTLLPNVYGEKAEHSTGPVFSEHYRDYLLESQFALELDAVTQEQIEVTAPEYPGLQIELPQLRERIQVPKPKLLSPTHSPNYYQGGQILTYWGFPQETGELVTVSPPLEKED